MQISNTHCSVFGLSASADTSRNFISEDNDPTLMHACAMCTISVKYGPAFPLRQDLQIASESQVSNSPTHAISFPRTCRSVRILTKAHECSKIVYLSCYLGDDEGCWRLTDGDERVRRIPDGRPRSSGVDWFPEGQIKSLNNPPRDDDVHLSKAVNRSSSIARGQTCAKENEERGNFMTSLFVIFET